jgi:pentatricopeptide repeat protein
MNLESSNSVLAERKESFEKSMAQLKSALKIAKSGKKDGVQKRARVDMAKDLADTIINEGYEIGNKEAHMIISVYKLADDGSGAYVGRASEVLEGIISRGVMPDTMIFNNIIDMFAKCRNSVNGNKMALHHLGRMKELGVIPDLLTYTSIITSSARLGKWNESISLLNEITTKHGIKPDRVIYTAVIKACSDSGRWREAILMLAKMKETGVPLDSAACNSAITACAVMAKWEAALKVFNFMKQESLEIDHYTYSALISAYDRGDQEHLIKDLYHEIMEITTNIKGADDETRNKFAAPLNTIIKYYARVGETASKGVEVYQRMIALEIARNEISYTTLITSLAKEKKHKLVVDLFKQVQKEIECDLIFLVANKAIAGSILHAAAYEKDWESVAYVLTLFTTVHRQHQKYRGGNEEAQIDAIDLFNLVLATACRTETYDVSRKIWILMETTGVPWNDESYTSMILAYKREGMWKEAMVLLDKWEEHSTISSSSKKVYSACISVLVESKKWQEALSVLDKMESKGVVPSEVTFNSAIEALDASEEYVRAELVFQSALRMEGVYSTWLLEETNNDDQGEFVTLDLHRLPVAVAKAAVRHVLSEMCTGRLAVANLVIITGRGRGTPSRFSSSTERGLMRSSVLDFLRRLGLPPEGLKNNAGRLIVRKTSLQRWFLEQERDDEEKRKMGTGAHGNLFLSVARAKKANLGDVRAVCPFSSATEPKIPADANKDTELEFQNTPSKCPAHSIAQAQGNQEDHKEKSGSTCPVHALENPSRSVETESKPKRVSFSRTQLQLEPTHVRCPAHEERQYSTNGKYSSHSDWVETEVERNQVLDSKCPARK